MKKLTLIALPALALILGSCKKDRTCECTTTSTSTYTDKNGNSSTNASLPSTSKTEYKKVKKSSVEVLCGDKKYASTSSNSDGSSSTYVSEEKCTIK